MPHAPPLRGHRHNGQVSCTFSTLKGVGYAPQPEMMSYAPPDFTSQRVSIYQAQAAAARADSYARDGNNIATLLAVVGVAGFAAYKLSRTA